MGRRVLASIDSTSAEAARISGGLSRPEWILALSQSAARGRRGRVWQSPAGNFAATYVFRPDCPPERVALFSFVAALALADAVDAVIGPLGGVALKWPNDVLLHGGKLAGILLESSGQAGQISHLCIGIGVNLVAAPAAAEVEPGAVVPVSLMGETGIRIAPEEFLSLLAPAFAAREAVFLSQGFAPIRAAWLARAARLGEVITARSVRETVQGRFETVDEGGALVLKTANGLTRVQAADVFF